MPIRYKTPELEVAVRPINDSNIELVIRFTGGDPKIELPLNLAPALARLLGEAFQDWKHMLPTAMLDGTHR